jgi:hypothetical protein
MMVKMSFMKRLSTQAYCWFKSSYALGWLRVGEDSKKNALRD